MRTCSPPLLVSACLLGLDCRYNLEAKNHPAVQELLQRQGWLPIPACPEQLGGLPTPRPASRFTGGDGGGVLNGTARVVDARGQDITEAFLKGARETLYLARLTGCHAAILKDRSPSCGVSCVHIDDRMQPGLGVTTALLKQSCIAVFSEKSCLTALQGAPHRPGRS